MKNDDLEIPFIFIVTTIFSIVAVIMIPKSELMLCEAQGGKTLILHNPNPLGSSETYCLQKNEELTGQNISLIMNSSCNMADGRYVETYNSGDFVLSYCYVLDRRVMMKYSDYEVSFVEEKVR